MPGIHTKKESTESHVLNNYFSISSNQVFVYLFQDIIKRREEGRERRVEEPKSRGIDGGEREKERKGRALLFEEQDSIQTVNSMR